MGPGAGPDVSAKRSCIFKGTQNFEVLFFDSDIRRWIIDEMFEGMWR
jgi:hypothetical protein